MTSFHTKTMSDVITYCTQSQHAIWRSAMKLMVELLFNALKAIVTPAWRQGPYQPGGPGPGPRTVHKPS